MISNDFLLKILIILIIVVVFAVIVSFFAPIIIILIIGIVGFYIYVKYFRNRNRRIL